MSAWLLEAAAAAVAAAAPAPAAATADTPAEPVHFEVVRRGTLVWQGRIAPGQTLSLESAEAERQCRRHCENASRTRSLYLQLSIPPYPQPSKGRDELEYIFSWTRKFDPNPDRPVRRNEVRADWTLRKEGNFHLGRHQPVTLSLPDDVRLTFRR